MNEKVVYAFRDPRYEIGIKVGCGSLANCLHDAQGYAPDGVFCEAYWPIPSSEPARVAEARVHEALKRRRINRLEVASGGATRSGTEWFDCDRAEAVRTTSEVLGTALEGPPVRGLRADKVLSSPARQGRLVLWVLEECLTRRLKLNTCSEFMSPIAPRRRYSRNGYREVAAYVIEPPISLGTNKRLFEIRREVLSRYARDERAAHYGWCSDGFDRHRLTTELSNYSELDIWPDLSVRPPGVRPSYTGKGSSVPDAELDLFSRKWW